MRLVIGSTEGNVILEHPASMNTDAIIVINLVTGFYIAGRLKWTEEMVMAKEVAKKQSLEKERHLWEHLQNWEITIMDICRCKIKEQSN